MAMDLGLCVKVRMRTQMATVLKPVIVKPKRSQLTTTATQLFSYRPNFSALRLRCSASSNGDAIILRVGGMMCEGCADTVKRILESRPQVSSATVNLASQIAIVTPVSQEKAAPNWHDQLGETLAQHLTASGFNSTLPPPGQQDTH